ncbi:LysR family transcriptional regulator [Paenibacillus sp. JTLBN-2024]
MPDLQVDRMQSSISSKTFAHSAYVQIHFCLLPFLAITLGTFVWFQRSYIPSLPAGMKSQYYRNVKRQLILSMNCVNIHRFNLYIGDNQKRIGGDLTMMNLNLLKLQIIELLEKHHKITTVADLLGLKQPTVTFHMKNLEREFGVKLFDARMGRIILTDAGRALLHYASKINALASEAQRVVNDFDTLKQGTLSIGASYVPATYILPSILDSFTKSFPGIRVTLSVKTAPAIMQMLHSHQIDARNHFHHPLFTKRRSKRKRCAKTSLY